MSVITLRCWFPFLYRLEPTAEEEAGWWLVCHRHELSCASEVVFSGAVEGTSPGTWSPLKPHCLLFQAQHPLFSHAFFNQNAKPVSPEENISFWVLVEKAGESTNCLWHRIIVLPYALCTTLPAFFHLQSLRPLLALQEPQPSWLFQVASLYCCILLSPAQLIQTYSYKLSPVCHSVLKWCAQVREPVLLTRDWGRRSLPSSLSCGPSAIFLWPWLVPFILLCICFFSLFFFPVLFIRCFYKWLLLFIY